MIVIFWGLNVEENFDIDKHIDKIKSQMNNDNQSENLNISDVPEDISQDVPNNEPSLEGYGNETDISESQENPENVNEIEELENSQENTYDTQENEWQDPFGTNANDAVKKYVIYIAKDFVPLIDSMDKDARSAFINESIQSKLQIEGKDKKWYSFVRVLRHIIVSVFTLLVAVPALFWLADKSITATVQNYEYVQKNFEKLYKEKVDREKAAREIKQLHLGL